MKRELFLFLGVLCSLGNYSCKKTEVRNSVQVEPMESTNKSKTGPESAIFDPSGLISPSAHATLDTFGKGFGFTEGPAVDHHGNVFFTDQPNDRIYRWDASTGAINLFLQGTGRSNGMEFDRDGNLIACADMHGEVWKIHPDGTHEILVNNYGGKLLNGPNDVWINPVTGGMYFTDPMFPRGYWDNTDPRKIGNAPGWPPIYSEQGPGVAGNVYYLAPGSHTLAKVTTMAGWPATTALPNGIVGTPDGRKLYVNIWTGDATGKIWSFDINPDGTLSNMNVYVNSLTGGDGMSMDEKGNIYVSHSDGVTAFDPAGNRILNIPLGASGSNNVFAGQNNKLLFITGPVDRVTGIKMNVKGVEKF
jgi:gluconolactonase